jgi:DNA-binding NtrC family response regulator
VGETGTGKELVARALTPPDKKLVVVDCTTLNERENLLEAELFGYSKGAFTGADRDKNGLLLQADGQVLFLDELHQLSLGAQAKLLRLLQEFKFRKLGDPSGQEYSVQFKVIAAAQPQIIQKIRDGLFLEDLYYRVAQLEIRVPALRERQDDVALLVNEFQKEFNQSRDFSDQKQFRISTINIMSKHEWTGNVRQLKNATLRMLTLCKTKIIEPCEFYEHIAPKTQDDRISLLPLSRLKDEMERKSIVDALERSTSLMEASAMLRISRWTLRRKLDQYNIDSEFHLPKNKLKKGESKC